MSADKILVENVVRPGKTTAVDRRKYEAMREAMLTALPKAQPGLERAAVVEVVKPYLPPDVFPGGDTAGWWSKCVQLDLEAKGLLARHGRPARWYVAEGEA